MTAPRGQPNAGTCPNSSLLPSAVLATLTAALSGCTPVSGGACPDSGDQMDASVLGVEGADFGRECEALCPGGTPLGSVEGTVAVACDSRTCSAALFDVVYPHCAFAVDLYAWQAAKCPECRLAPYKGIDGQASPATCAFDYDYTVVLCDSSK